MGASEGLVGGVVAPRGEQPIHKRLGKHVGEVGEFFGLV
jgi:hypothetical protein